MGKIGDFWKQRFRVRVTRKTTTETMGELTVTEAAQHETSPAHQEHVYSVYDNKMMAYMAPFTARNDEVAIRHFQSGLQQDGMIRRNPEDFSLWRVGGWNPESAVIVTAKEGPLQIAKAHELLARMQAAENQHQLSLLQGGE